MDGKEVGEGSLSMNDIEHIDNYKISIYSFLVAEMAGMAQPRS
jgi:hypothetical protein